MLHNSAVKEIVVAGIEDASMIADGTSPPHDRHYVDRDRDYDRRRSPPRYRGRSRSRFRSPPRYRLITPRNENHHNDCFGMGGGPIMGDGGGGIGGESKMNGGMGGKDRGKDTTTENYS